MTTFESKRDWQPTWADGRPGRAITPAPHSLIQAVQEAVRMMDDFALRPVVQHAGSLAFQPKALLALVSYCYAREIYGSAQVEQVMRRDANFCHLCQGEVPGARIINRFCHENREAVQLCLTAALRCLFEQKVDKGAITKVSESRLGEEARRRIVTAMFIDSTELADAC